MDDWNTIVSGIRVAISTSFFHRLWGPEVYLVDSKWVFLSQQKGGDDFLFSLTLEAEYLLRFGVLGTFWGSSHTSNPKVFGSLWP